MCKERPTMLPPVEFAQQLLKEAEDTHPWLHHPLFHMIWEGKLSRDQVRNIATESINATHVVRMAEALEKHYGIPKSALDFYYVHAHVEDDHRDRAVRILTELCVTEATQTTGLYAMRRAITARRICIDGLMEALVRKGN